MYIVCSISFRLSSLDFIKKLNILFDTLFFYYNILFDTLLIIKLKFRSYIDN